MKQSWQALYDQIQSVVHIPDEEWSTFQSLVVPKRMNKNNTFVKQGETTDSIVFCLNGLLRLYYTTADGLEFNKSFCKAGDFTASYRALLTDSPSYFTIEALIDSELLLIRYEHLHKLYSRHVCWERLGRVLAEQLYIKKEQREYELLMLSAPKRYQLFLEMYADVIKHIPQYHIASYLGITPVALSRIRRKLT